MSVLPKDPNGPITNEMRAELRQRWPDCERLAAAWRLACDLETLCDLVAGRPVATGRLDRAALVAARRRSLVQLRAPIALLDISEVAA